MRMYCRDCKDNVKVEKRKLKDDHAKLKGYYCIKCGVRLLLISENRRHYP